MGIMKRITLSLLALVALPGPVVARTWTEAESGRTIEAELVGVGDGTATLERTDGRRFELPLARLSDADRAFIEEQGPMAVEAGADWPSWRGPKRDNRSPDTGLLKTWPEGGPKLVWTFEDGGKGYSAPAIVGGKIYITGTRGDDAEIICLDAATAKEQWSAKIGDDEGEGYMTRWGGGTRGAPTVSDGLVYAMTANGTVACVGAEDGKVKWRKDLVGDFGGSVPRWGYAESPLVDGNRLIVTPGGAQGAIVAFDKVSGDILWQSEELKDGAHYSSVIVAEPDGRRQYIQLFEKKLAGVDAESGKLLWTVGWPDGRTAVIPTPALDGDRVYVTSGYGAGSMLVKLTGDGAEEVWRNKVMKVHHGGVVLVDGHAYGLSDGGGLVCQNLDSGELVWNQRGRGTQKGAVHYADGMLYGLDEEEGSVFLAEATAAEFRERGRFELPQETELREGTMGKVWTHPVVIGGKLYLRDQDLLFCFDVSGGS